MGYVAIIVGLLFLAFVEPKIALVTIAAGLVSSLTLKVAAGFVVGNITLGQAFKGVMYSLLLSSVVVIFMVQVLAKFGVSGLVAGFALAWLVSVIGVSIALEITFGAALLISLVAYAVSYLILWIFGISLWGGLMLKQAVS